MSKIIVIYHSLGGNTKKMAELVAKGIKDEGVEVDLKPVEEVSAQELTGYQGIIIGSPTYYGSMCAQIKALIDDSVKIHGELDGRVGAAFSSSANVGGGNETTILDILNAMLIHGMIIKGDFQGDHYGPVAIGAPDDRAGKECLKLGGKVAGLVKKLFG